MAILSEVVEVVDVADESAPPPPPLESLAMPLPPWCERLRALEVDSARFKRLAALFAARRDVFDAEDVAAAVGAAEAARGALEAHARTPLRRSTAQLGKATEALNTRQRLLEEATDEGTMLASDELFVVLAEKQRGLRRALELAAAADEAAPSSPATPQ